MSKSIIAVFPSFSHANAIQLIGTEQNGRSITLTRIRGGDAILQFDPFDGQVDILGHNFIIGTLPGHSTFRNNLVPYLDDAGEYAQHNVVIGIMAKESADKIFASEGQQPYDVIIGD